MLKLGNIIQIFSILIDVQHHNRTIASYSETTVSCKLGLATMVAFEVKRKFFAILGSELMYIQSWELKDIELIIRVAG